MKLFLQCHLFILLLINFQVKACDLPDTSVVFFKIFSTQTYLPVLKKDFQIGKQGGKMVIKNSFFKKILEDSKSDTDKSFVEDIRMTVKFNGKMYFLNTLGQIEVDNLVVGKLSKEIMYYLDKGYYLYEWKTCKPMDEVITLMLKKNKKHLMSR